MTEELRNKKYTTIDQKYAMILKWLRRGILEAA